MAKASGKAASSATPPSTSQVSLPSQIGAIEFITRLRESRSGAKPYEDADAEVEAVEQHVEKHADAEHQRPDRHEIENRPAHGRPAPVRGSASTGASGRPLSMTSGSTRGLGRTEARDAEPSARRPRRT